MSVGKQHAENEQAFYAEIEDKEAMRLWGSYFQIASEVYGDAGKAEALAEMILKLGRREQRIDEQREKFEKCLFG